MASRLQSGFRAATKCPALKLQAQRLRRRDFSVSTRWQIRTKEMNEELLGSLKVEKGRLMGDIHHTCQWGVGERWGRSVPRTLLSPYPFPCTKKVQKYRSSFLLVCSAPTETGMSRLALSDADKSVRDWFVSTTEALGCKTTVDSMGNIFAVRPGLRNDKPPTFVGSHLDTQPTGGRYDGILGVTAGVEMLRVLGDNWVETEYPVGVVNWTKCVYSTY